MTRGITKAQTVLLIQAGITPGGTRARGGDVVAMLQKGCLEARRVEGAEPLLSLTQSGYFALGERERVYVRERRAAHGLPSLT